MININQQKSFKEQIYQLVIYNILLIPTIVKNFTKKI